jgi:hypothetical protein
MAGLMALNLPGHARRGAWLLLVAAAVGAACDGDDTGPTDVIAAGAAGEKTGGTGGIAGFGPGGDAGDAGSGGTQGGRVGSAGSAGKGDAAGAGSGGDAGMSGAGAGGEAAGGGASGGGGSAGDSGEPMYPALLSETGLYADIESEELADGVEAYHPRYELWSDGAEKRRWVKLPAGAVIDTSDLDFWSYPMGTRLFKEFTAAGTRVETRLLHKQAAGWAMVSYLWNDDQRDAVAVPDGVIDALGTDHDVPSAAKCAICHDKMPDRVLGFSAVQLSHAEDGITLDSLVLAGRLSAPPASALALPGDATAQAALGYLHANCGICHNAQSFVSEVTSAMFWLESAKLGTVEATPVYETTVNQPQDLALPGADALIAAGQPDKSAVVLRMQQRETEEQMPPIASDVADATGLAAVTAWIDSLD